jgi:hypothetical protein
MTEENNVPIGIEQICAAIIAKYEKIEVTLDQILSDYSNKSIAVNQDPDTKSVTFSLVDNPVLEEVQAEKE